MIITSNKTYEKGERVICIISSNSYLIRGKEYTVKKFSDSGEVYLDGYDLDGYSFNPARFISTSEIRNYKIEKILKK
jgi:hypothetical protein